MSGDDRDVVVSRTQLGHVGHLGTLLSEAWLSQTGERDLFLSLDGRRELVHSVVVATHSRAIAQVLAHQPLPTTFLLDRLPVSRKSLFYFLRYAYTGSARIPIEDLAEVGMVALALQAPRLLQRLEILARSSLGDPDALPVCIRFAFSIPTAQATRLVVLNRAVLEFPAISAHADCGTLPLAFLSQFLHRDDLPINTELDAYRFLLRCFRHNPSLLSNFNLNLLLDTIRFHTLTPDEMKEAYAMAHSLNDADVLREVKERLELAELVKSTPPDDWKLTLVNTRPPRGTKVDRSALYVSTSGLSCSKAAGSGAVTGSESGESGTKMAVGAVPVKSTSLRSYGGSWSDENVAKASSSEKRRGRRAPSRRERYFPDIDLRLLQPSPAAKPHTPNKVDKKAPPPASVYLDLNMANSKEHYLPDNNPHLNL